MTRLLFVSPDRVAPEMPGPGIRYLELARATARTHDVALAAPTGSEPLADAPTLAIYDPDRPRTLRRLFDDADVVVAPPLAPALVEQATRRGRAWIVDFYNPEPFEGLEQQRSRPRLERKVRDVTRIDRIGFAARRGSAFICDSERQRDMWLGFLAACRRLDSDQYEHDNELRTLIDVVPFGVPSEAPRPGPAPVARGTRFPENARIMVWNGGLWDWMDPLTPIRALALLRRGSADWRLVFNGAGRPSHREQMGMPGRARGLADELGLVQSEAIYFRPGWTPYAERGWLLLEADVGISTHPPTLEARFAHRSRMLDFLWTRLPILCTEGAAWSNEVVARELGEAVRPGDPEAFAAAAERIAARGRAAYEPALAAAAAERTWDRAVAPLLRLVDSVLAADRRHLSHVASIGLRLRYSTASAARHVRR